MAAPYRVTGTPKVPNVPHPMPATLADGTNYVLPKPKMPRPPIRNPYDMFSQNDFDVWIGGITGALRQALGQTDEEITTTQTKSSSIVDTPAPVEFKKGQTQFDETYGDTASDTDSEGLIEDSFAEIKARKLLRLAKGKARDPREGPGLGAGDKQNPIEIDLVSDEEENCPQQRAQSEEDLEEEQELESQLIPNDWEDEEEESDDDHAIHPWQGDRTSMAVKNHVRDESIERVAPEEGQEGDDFDESDGREDIHERSSPIEIIDEDEEEREGATDSDGGMEDQDEGYEEYSDQEVESHGKPQITTARSAGLQQQFSSDEYSEEDELDEVRDGEGAASFQREVIDLEAEDEDPAQPLAEDTSFPPISYQGRPVDLPDPWHGPRTYAQDYYAGGDIRSQPRRPLSADYLGPDDEVAGFLTPDVVTPVVQSQEVSDEDEEAAEMYGEHAEFEDELEGEEYEDATPPPTRHQHIVRTQPEVINVDDEERMDAQSPPAGAINIEIDAQTPIYDDGIGDEVDELTGDIDIQIQAPSPYSLIRTPSPEDAFQFGRKYGVISEEIDNDTPSTADNTPILTAQVDWSVTDTLPDGTRRTVAERQRASATAEHLHTGVYYHPPTIPDTISDSSCESTPTTAAPSLYAPTPFELTGVPTPELRPSDGQPIMPTTGGVSLPLAQPIPADEPSTTLEPLTPAQVVDVEQHEDAHASPVLQLADGVLEFPLLVGEQEGDDDQAAQPTIPVAGTPAHPQHYNFTTLPTPPSERGYSADETIIPTEALVQQSLDNLEAFVDEIEEVGVESATGSQVQIHEAEEELEETHGQSERDQEVQQELVEEEVAIVGEQVVEEVKDRGVDLDETMGVPETLLSQVDTKPEMQVEDWPSRLEDWATHNKEARGQTKKMAELGHWPSRIEEWATRSKEARDESEKLVETPPAFEDDAEVTVPKPLDEAKGVPPIRVNVSQGYLVSEVLTPILDEDGVTDEDAYGEIDMELDIESIYEIGSAHATEIMIRDPVVEEVMTEGRLTTEPSDRGTSIAIASLNTSAINTPTFEKPTLLPETDEAVLVPSAQTSDELSEGGAKTDAERKSGTPQGSITVQPLRGARQGSLPGGIPMPISADPTVPDPTSRPHSSLAFNRSPEAEDEIPGLSVHASTNVDNSDLATEGADLDQSEQSPAHASTSSQHILLPPTVMRALNLQRTGSSNTFNGLFTPVVGGSSGDATPVTPVSTAGAPDHGDQGAVQKKQERTAITANAEAFVQEVGEGGSYDDDSIASSSPSVNNDPLPPASPEDDIYFAEPADNERDSLPMDENAITVESLEFTDVGLRQESTLFLESEDFTIPMAEGTLTSLEEVKAQVVQEEELLGESLVIMSDPEAIPGLGSFSNFNPGQASPFDTARSSPHPAQTTQFTSPASPPRWTPSALSRHASTPQSTLATTSHTVAPSTLLPVTMIPRKSTDPILYADPYPYSLSTPGVDHSKDEGYEEDMDLEGSSSSAEDDDSIPSRREPNRKAAATSGAAIQNESNDDLDLLYPSDTEFQLYGQSALDNAQKAKAQATTKSEADQVTQTMADTATFERAEGLNTKDLGYEDAHGDKDADGDVDPDFIAVAEQPSIVTPLSEQEQESEPSKPAIDPKTEIDPFKLMGNDSVVSPHLEDIIVEESSSSEESSGKEAHVKGPKETTPKPDEAEKHESQTEPVSQKPSQAPEPPAPTSTEAEIHCPEEEEEREEEEKDRSSGSSSSSELAPSRRQKRKRATSPPVVPPRHSRSAASRRASQIPRYKGKVPATNKTMAVPRTRKIKPIIKRKGPAEQSRARGQSVESSSSGASVASRMLKPTSRASSVASSATSDRQKPPSANHFRPRIPPPLFHAHGRGRHQHILPMPPPQLQPVPEVPRAPTPNQVESVPSTSGETVPKPSSSSDKVPTQSDPLAAESLPEPTTATPSLQPPPPSTSQRPHATASSTPVTRSHCRYHRISIPKTEDGPRVFFLVPGCSLGDEELIEEEEIEDHGDATHEDTLRIVADIETLDFEDYLFGVLRQLCGPDLLQKQEVFYLRQPGEQVVRKPRPKKSTTERLSHARQSVGASTSHAGVTSPKNLSALMRSPSSSRAPHSIAGSASSRRRHEGDNLSISDLGSDLTEEDDYNDDEDSNTEPKQAKRQKVTSFDLSGSHTQASGSQPSASARTRRGKVKKLGPDAMAYKPRSDTEVESGAEEMPPRRRKRRGTKRSRVDGAPEEEGEGSRRAKRIRTRPVATERS